VLNFFSYFSFCIAVNFLNFDGLDTVASRYFQILLKDKISPKVLLAKRLLLIRLKLPKWFRLIISLVSQLSINYFYINQ